MRKSARVLGQEFGLTAQEMNFVLKEEGFLEGEPGSYSITEKGEKYAEEQDHHRGTGGYDWYNRYWTTRTWDDGIADALDITDDRKREIRQAISTAKQQIDESSDGDAAIEFDSCSSEDADTADPGIRPLVAAVGVLLVAYGIYRATPRIERLWNEKAVPVLKNMKNRVTGKAEKLEEEADGDRDSLTSEEA